MKFLRNVATIIVLFVTFVFVSVFVFGLVVGFMQG